MLYIHTQTTMNPSVEDINEGENGAIPVQGSKAENGQLSWPQICSQHEFVLSSHLDMLQNAKERAQSDDNMFRTISSMLDKTNKLMSQFRIVKKQMDSTGASGKQSAPQVDDANSTTTSASNPPIRKKRARSGDANESGTELSRLQESRSQKRKRVEIPGNDEDLRNTTPVFAAETEDISEEVQRRLLIKEEQRKKRNANPEKRKRDRDSLLSNDGIVSLGDTARPKKRRRGEQTGSD